MASQRFSGSTSAPSNPDTIPTPNDLSGPCPRCGRISNFKHEEQSLVLRTFKRPNVMGHVQERADLLTCNGCQETTVIVTERFGSHEYGLMHVYPAPGAGALDNQVNQRVASAYDEGMKCLSIGANRAAAVMFRSALSLFVKDKGSEKAKSERHLKNALRNMKDEGDLHRSLWEWADHLNQLGNEGAHPEDYDDVTADEAAGLGKFVRHLIRHEYEMPAQLLRDQGLLVEEELDAEEAAGSGASGDPSLYGGLNPRINI